MLACMQDVLEQSQRDGFPLARVMGHAEWASGDWPGVDDFLEYECRLNDIIPQYKDAVICLYNLTKCGGNLIIDVIRTHPMILIGGIVQENPFFVPPDEFLRNCANAARPGLRYRPEVTYRWKRWKRRPTRLSASKACINNQTS